MKISDMIDKLQEIKDFSGDVNVIIRCGNTISGNIEIENIDNESYCYDRISIVDKNRD